jgi:phosphoglycolate phosphatase (TIGR01487 family)
MVWAPYIQQETRHRQLTIYLILSLASWTNCMGIKAVVVDIDGTLTDMNKIMSTSGIDALRKVQDNGVPVSLASGNVLPVAYGLSTYLGLKGPIVAENGGVVSYREEIYQVAEGRVPERAFEHLRTRMPVERLFTDRWRTTEVALRRTADLERVRAELKGWDVVIEATGFAIHIMDPGHGKLAGVTKMADIVGIDVSQVAAFGDSDNDVGMLRGCGESVAVANASDGAKSVARYVSPFSHADGVIDGLRRLNLL